MKLGYGICGFVFVFGKKKIKGILLYEEIIISIDNRNCIWVVSINWGIFFCIRFIGYNIIINIYINVNYFIFRRKLWIFLFFIFRMG